MKKFLRKWLEIPEIPEIPDTSKFVDGNDVKQFISDAIVEAFTPWERPHPLEIPPVEYVMDLRGKFESVIRDRVVTEVSINFDSEIGKIINTEEFIDDVIERILRKQLVKG